MGYGIMLKEFVLFIHLCVWLLSHTLYKKSLCHFVLVMVNVNMNAHTPYTVSFYFFQIIFLEFSTNLHQKSIVPLTLNNKSIWQKGECSENFFFFFFFAVSFCEMTSIKNTSDFHPSTSVNLLLNIAVQWSCSLVGKSSDVSCNYASGCLSSGPDLVISWSWFTHIYIRDTWRIYELVLMQMGG